MQHLAGAFDRQDAAVVGERVQHHGGVLACLDHFVQIADAAGAHGLRERTVAPHGAAGGDQVAADQVGGGQVVVAADGEQRQLQTGCHVGHEARLAAAGGALDQHGQVLFPGLLEQLALLAGGLVIGDFEHGLVHGVHKGVLQSLGGAASAYQKAIISPPQARASQSCTNRRR